MVNRNYLLIWLSADVYRTGIIKAIFSYTGMDIFAATAAESKSLGDAESMKMAARKISLRIVTIYCFAVFTATFVVPYNHPFLNGEAQSVSAASIFIIAVVEAGSEYSLPQNWALLYNIWSIYLTCYFHSSSSCSLLQCNLPLVGFHLRAELDVECFPPSLYTCPAWANRP